jgi:hypothetical protein
VFGRKKMKWSCFVESGATCSPPKHALTSDGANSSIYRVLPLIFLFLLYFILPSKNGRGFMTNSAIRGSSSPAVAETNGTFAGGHCSMLIFADRHYSILLLPVDTL